MPVPDRVPGADRHHGSGARRGPAQGGVPESVGRRRGDGCGRAARVLPAARLKVVDDKLASLNTVDTILVRGDRQLLVLDVTAVVRGQFAVGELGDPGGRRA